MRSQPLVLATFLRAALKDIDQSTGLGGAGRIVVNDDRFHNALESIRAVSDALEEIGKPATRPQCRASCGPKGVCSNDATHLAIGVRGRFLRCDDHMLRESDGYRVTRLPDPAEAKR